MIFIFDWGYTTDKVIGPIGREDVGGDVGAQDFYLLIRRTEWFRMFFIPTIPTARRYYLQEERGGLEREVDKDFYERYKGLAELNAEVRKGTCDEGEYQERRSQLGF